MTFTSETVQMLQNGMIHSDILIESLFGLLIAGLAGTLVIVLLNCRHARQVEQYYENGFDPDQTFPHAAQPPGLIEAVSLLDPPQQCASCSFPLGRSVRLSDEWRRGGVSGHGYCGGTAPKHFKDHRFYEKT